MKKTITRIAAASALGLIISASASADTFQAQVTILQSLAIAETTAVNFGNISNTDGICTMASGGGLSGTNGCTGTATPGVFNVTGSDVTIDLAVSPGAAVDGVTYTPAIDGSSTPTLSGGSTTVTVVGELSLASATAGAKAINFELTANYQ